MHFIVIDRINIVVPIPHILHDMNFLWVCAFNGFIENDGVSPGTSPVSIDLKGLNWDRFKESFLEGTQMSVRHVPRKQMVSIGARLFYFGGIFLCNQWNLVSF